MNCPECQSDLMEDAVFCHACGKRVAGGVSKRRRRHRKDPGNPNFPGESLNVARGSGSPKRTDDELSGPPLRGPVSGRFRKARRRLQSLTPNDEEIELWSGTYSAKGMVNHWFWAAVATILIPVGAASFAADQPYVWPIVAVTLLLMWLGLGAMVVFQKLDVHYELTNQRLVHKVGILRRITNRIEVIDIDDVTFEQGIIERLLGVGSIAIFSSDRTDPSILMSGIDEVFEVAELIDEARRAERVRRGIHIEAV